MGVPGLRKPGSGRWLGPPSIWSLEAWLVAGGWWLLPDHPGSKLGGPSLDRPPAARSMQCCLLQGRCHGDQPRPQASERWRKAGCSRPLRHVDSPQEAPGPAGPAEDKPTPVPLGNLGLEAVVPLSPSAPPSAPPSHLLGSPSCLLDAFPEPPGCLLPSPAPAVPGHPAAALASEPSGSILRGSCGSAGACTLAEARASRGCAGDPRDVTEKGRVTRGSRSGNPVSVLQNKRKRSRELLWSPGSPWMTAPGGRNRALRGWGSQPGRWRRLSRGCSLGQAGRPEQ